MNTASLGWSRFGVAALVALAAHASAAHAVASEQPASERSTERTTWTATGVVFDDRNGNGLRDAGEPGVANVGVSNGRAIVETDAVGRYEIDIDDDDIVFVLKPRDYAVPVNEHNIPQRHYIHKPNGSPAGLRYGGVRPTGELPDSIDFALRRSPEPDTFRVVYLGDPQPYSRRQIDYIAQDVAAELVGVDAAFGVVLGDIVGDDLTLFDPLNAVFGRIGIPMWYVFGNHDMDFDVPEAPEHDPHAVDHLADETFERVYGPANYSFDYGPVHFLVIDDVLYKGGDEIGNYHAELTDEALRFIEADLERVDRDTLVVLQVHIPVWEIRNRRELFELLEPFENTFSIGAHWHMHRHVFFDESDGWFGDEPHHHMVNVTVSGSWWRGAPNELGVPHTMMRCGAPNGYTIVTFSDDDYSVRFKAAGKPASEQMHLYALSELPAEESRAALVYANVYNGSERSLVEMRVVREDGGATEWTPMERTIEVDPHFLRIKVQEALPGGPQGRELPRPSDSHHLWKLALPAALPAGAHVIEVRSTDMHGVVDIGRRIVRMR